MNAAVAVPPRPLPQRAPEQQHSPPVVVEARPQMQMQMPPQPMQPMYSPVAFAPTYAPNDPRLGGQPPPGYPMQPMPMQNIQQPTMLVQTRTGVPMWLVGVVSGVAALMVLLVVYLLVVPPHPQQRTASTGTGSTASTVTPIVAAGNGPFGAARGAFSTALSPTTGTTGASSSSVQPLPTTTASDLSTATSATTAPTTTAVTTAATATTATATATATVAVATARPTGPTQVPTNVDKGYLTLVTVPRCDSWSDNGTPIGTCPIVNKPLPVGAHRITLTTNVPKATKTISVIIISGQLSNPPLVMLSQ
jgi:hypothetical protein